MQTFNIENQRASLQVFDSTSSGLPDDWDVDFPSTDGYLCIPTQPDHLSGVILDIYSDTDVSGDDLELRYKGTIQCTSRTLIVGTGLPDEVTKIEFNEPGDKQVEVWTDHKKEPKHVAIKVIA